MYQVKISYLKTYILYQVGIVLFFGIFCVYGGVSSTLGSWEEINFFLFTLSLISFAGALMFTFFTPLMFSSRLTPEGIVACFGITGLIHREEFLRWEEINSFFNQWVTPYYIVRKKRSFTDWIPDNLGVALLPKSLFLKDKQGFLTYLDKVLPPDHKLRAYYF
jgi:hypothetical protein